MNESETTCNNGWLALVATPIGNLEDMTLRALRTLREADLIAAEDTRRARKLCAHFDIHTPLTSYHAHNEHRKTTWVLHQVVAGKRIAVLSDAGTPAVSDPGFLIVREALRLDIEPRIVPGVSAVTFAVMAAGLPVDQFTFLGYAPVKAGKRRTFLESLQGREATYILFESPHRLGRLLEEIHRDLGPETRLVIIREATKWHEESLRGTAASLLAQHAGRRWRGECTVVLRVSTAESPAPADPETRP
ncbi:MAG: 16S rRNA (cytidine(1402)-2'-O)-methyltransferase [Kiritimatiellaeota bacterium]|nr:16S rRNA (cytidine(1402)-2'-O)-methyltransferase [Kiritimatiellota bacterium]